MIVYRHIRLDKNEVFYIGIGSDMKRPYDKCDRNKYWNNVVNKTEYRVDILFDDLTWEECKDKEIELIKLYGRKDLGLGTLVNMTDGGEGLLGFKHSEETKQKIRDTKKRNPQVHSDEYKNKMSEKLKGREFSKEHKERLSKSNIGRKLSDESRKKMSDSRKGKMSEKQLEHIKEMCKNNIGRKHTEETKKKMSDAQK